MVRIFISYRREDTQIIAGRIYSDLSLIFGAHNIFFDRYAIPDGVDFRVYLHKAVSECDVLLVVIGPKWLNISEPQQPGTRRLDNENDFVRIEVETALKQNKKIIPLLVDGASIPRASELPPAIKDIAFRHMRQIRHDPDYRRDIEDLVSNIKSNRSGITHLFSKPNSIKKWNYALIAILLIFVIIGAALVINQPQDVALLPTGTSGPTHTATDSPTETPNPTDTATDTATETPNPTDTATDAPTETQGPTLSAREVLLLTRTAQSFTPTPSRTGAVTPTLTPYPLIAADNLAQLDEIDSPLQGHGSTVRTLAFNYDGSRIVSGSSDYTVRVWNADLRESAAEAYSLEWRIAEHNDWINAAEFSKDGRLLVTASRNGLVIVWDVENRTEIARLTKTPVGRVRFSPDGALLAIGLSNGTIELWDISTATNLLTLTGHEGWVQSLDFSPDGTSLISGGADGTVRLWDIFTGEERRQFLPVLQRVNVIRFSSDGRYIAGGTNDGITRVWDVETGERAASLSGDLVWDIAFSPDDTLLAIASNNQSVYLWDWKSENRPVQLTGHSAPVRSIAFRPDGRVVISGGQENENSIRFWGIVGN